jgi:hypothetical protein
MASRSTALRFIRAPNTQDLSVAVDRLPFKVEIKEIVQDSKGAWLCFFVVPDEALEFQNLDLGE